jgi:hypothetical protein
MTLVLLINAFIFLSNYRIIVNICYPVVNFLLIIFNSTVFIVLDLM